MLAGAAAVLRSCVTTSRVCSTSLLDVAWAAQSTGRTACRSYAVAVPVIDNKIDAALVNLRRKCVEADLPKEIRKREHHMNKSQRKFFDQRASFNKAMGRIIKERVQWLAKRKLVKL